MQQQHIRQRRRGGRAGLARRLAIAATAALLAASVASPAAAAPGDRMYWCTYAGGNYLECLYWAYFLQSPGATVHLDDRDDGPLVDGLIGGGLVTGVFYGKTSTTSGGRLA